MSFSMISLKKGADLSKGLLCLYGLIFAMGIRVVYTVICGMYIAWNPVRKQCYSIRRIVVLPVVFAVVYSPTRAYGKEEPSTQSML